MKVSTKGRYAVMALVDIAVHGGAVPAGKTSLGNPPAQAAMAGRPVSLAEVALRQEISLSYLEQLFARLRRAGLVRSVRGPGGGYLLGRPAEGISIAEVVQAVEEAARPLAAANAPAAKAPAAAAEAATIDPRALTQTLWDGLGNQIRAYLAGISLADVVGQGRRAAPAATDKRSAA
jgi:Rrf2 family iron-sulfur cluster assembly transcriptional regulator